MEKLILNKNRGWRGLAEAQLIDDKNNTEHKSIFSFSQEVWDDMLNGRFVIQTPTKFIVLKFDYEKSNLPKPTQQRSVLIKNVVLPITAKEEYSRDTWRDDHHTVADFNAIRHFLTNTNNHTTSDWNCVGIRVIPDIL